MKTASKKTDPYVLRAVYFNKGKFGHNKKIEAAVKGVVVKYHGEFLSWKHDPQKKRHIYYGRFNSQQDAKEASMALLKAGMASSGIFAASMFGDLLN